jgi:hypothetical protein
MFITSSLHIKSTSNKLMPCLVDGDGKAGNGVGDGGCENGDNMFRDIGV